MTVPTNWVAISGAPSSGKTSVIEALARRGYTTAGETARALISEKMSGGLTLAEVRADTQKLQSEILARNAAREAALDPAQLIFLDRAVGDSMTYFPLAGLDTAPVQEAASRFRYRAVFIFDRLPFLRDEVRSEDEAAAAKMDALAEEGYRALGYDPVRVPVLPIEERADFILRHLGLMAT